MEAKIRHLEMIQSAITQSTGNSLRIKGFAMLLLVGAVALLLSGDGGGSAIPVRFGLVLIGLVVVLAILDYYFLREADLFRILYNQVKAQDESAIDFSMDTSKFIQELNAQYTEHPTIPVVATMFFYSCALLVVLLGILSSF